MKKLVFSILALFLSVAVLQAQDKGPAIKFTKQSHDYGTIENGADGTCEFKFTNSGNEPLLISNCRASCGCTVPSWPKEPIQPGEASSIKVKYDTKRTGKIYKTITITSNAVNEPRKTVSIKGTVKPPKTAVGKAAPAKAAVKKPVVKRITPTPRPARKVVPNTQVAKKATQTPKQVVSKPVKKRRWFQFWKKKN
jgi:hypothetical protein